MHVPGVVNLKFVGADLCAHSRTLAATPNDIRFVQLHSGRERMNLGLEAVAPASGSSPGYNRHIKIRRGGHRNNSYVTRVSVQKKTG